MTGGTRDARPGEAPASGRPGNPLLDLRGIVKRFPGVVANDGIGFEVRPGEVLGLLGENGAGKSTLMHVVSGLLTPDEGEIRIDGQPAAFRSAADAIRAGIGMVHQHFMLVPTLSVVENVVLGDRRLDPVRPRLREHAEKVAGIGRSIGLPVDPFVRVGTLDIGTQQRVEIVKALYREARVLILDEPTAVLTEEEREGLFAMIRRLSASGVAVILISHKLDDIFAVCSRVVVLRQGRVVDRADIADCTRERLVEGMIGARVDLPDHHGRGADPEAALIVARDISVRRDNGSVALAGASFDLRRGEILAVAGVDGNGQRELAETLAGLRQPDRGRLDYPGLDIPAGFRPRALRRAGLRHVPGDRHATGVLPQASLVENQLLTHFFHRPFQERGLLRRSAARAAVAGIIDAYSVSAPGPSASMRTLSGGNQQKLVLGRELDAAAKVLIAVQPTRGLDIRTVAFIQETLAAKRDDGLAILLVSADLGEIWQIADRVMALSHGRLFGPKPLAETTLHEVGGWMAGH